MTHVPGPLSLAIRRPACCSDSDRPPTSTNHSPFMLSRGWKFFYNLNMDHDKQGVDNYGGFQNCSSQQLSSIF